MQYHYYFCKFHYFYLWQQTTSTVLHPQKAISVLNMRVAQRVQKQGMLLTPQERYEKE